MGDYFYGGVVAEAWCPVYGDDLTHARPISVHGRDFQVFRERRYTSYRLQDRLTVDAVVGLLALQLGRSIIMMRAFGESHCIDWPAAVRFIRDDDGETYDAGFRWMNGDEFRRLAIGDAVKTWRL